MTDFYEIWNRYSKSKTYIDKIGLIGKTEKHWLMYLGRQWEATNDSQGMENLPMMNFIKPTVKYKASTIASTSVTALFSDLNGERMINLGTEMTPEGVPMPVEIPTSAIIDKMNDLFAISWEKGKMNKCGKKGLRNAAVEGDHYFFWGEGGDTRKSPQLLHNTQLRFADENITNIQDQSWLIIEERLPPEVVRERAKALGVKSDDIALIKPDSELKDALVTKSEVSDKVTSLLYMEKDKKTGIVSVARCTPSVMYEKLHPISQIKRGEPIGTGLTMYPIVPMIWEEIPNNARGMSEVEQLIPNQLEVNKTLARRAISIKQTAYPRLAYNESMLENPEDLDKVGATIKLSGDSSQNVANMISYLAPQAMSQDAKTLSDELVNQTRTLAGASDAQLGNIDLSRVSGTAAQTIRDQQQLPLNEQQEMYQDFIENVALLWCELWKVYYPEGLEMDGIKITADELNAILPNVRVDIAEDTTLSKMAAQQELTNLFNNGKLTFAEYVKAYPEHSSISKDVLEQIVKEREERAAMGQPMVDEFGNPIDVNLLSDQQGVNVGGMSGGSGLNSGNTGNAANYQALQKQLAE